MKKMKASNLSIMVHVQNEEKRLRGFLENIKDFVDDIVVVDDYSTDNTEKIAKKYGCRVFKLRTDNFSEKDNFSANKCKNEWVLLLDVDERLTDEIKQAIIETMDSNPKENMFYVRRREFFMYRLYAITWQPRLYRRDKVVWTEPVHEVPVYDGKPGYIKKGFYDHYPPQDINTIISKLIKYTDLEVEKIGKISKSKLLFLMLFKPVYAFFAFYFYAGYIRGGIAGLTFAVNGAYYTFMTYAKYYQKHFAKSKKLPYE